MMYESQIITISFCLYIVALLHVIFFFMYFIWFGLELGFIKEQLFEII
jgi:hypothetical protein